MKCHWSVISIIEFQNSVDSSRNSVSIMKVGHKMLLFLLEFGKVIKLKLSCLAWPKYLGIYSTGLKPPDERY